MTRQEAKQFKYVPQDPTKKQRQELWDFAYKQALWAKRYMITGDRIAKAILGKHNKP